MFVEGCGAIRWNCSVSRDVVRNIEESFAGIAVASLSSEIVADGDYLLAMWAVECYGHVLNSDGTQEAVTASLNVFRRRARDTTADGATHRACGGLVVNWSSAVKRPTVK